jgi:hypothetical protein
VTQVSLAQVNDVRARIARAHDRAAAEFRHTFVQGVTPPTRHLEILARTLIEEARGVRVAGDAYTIEDGLITPVHENFEVDDDAYFEYWMIISEITGSAAWRMTKVIATNEEYDEALKRMRSPQIVRALIGSFLPSYERSSLEVTVYTRAGEERVERRMLTLDASNEFHYHGRELIAEGRGGVPL